MGEFDESVENTEFEFQFYTVRKGLIDGLDIVQTSVLESEYRNIESDNDGVDVDEMSESAPGSSASNVPLRLHDLDCLVDVQDRDGELLHEEYGDLDFFVNRVRDEEWIGITGVCAIDHDYYWDVADDGVKDDHVKHPAQLSGVS